MLSQKNKQAWRNPWFFGLAAIVLSGVLINAKMLWNVVHNPVRLLDENYSVKGHNKYDAKWVQQQAERSTLGWQANLHSPQRVPNDPEAMETAARFILAGTPIKLSLGLNDREGKPVQGGQVTVYAQWPGAPEFDTSILLQEAAPGNYVGDIDFSRPGNWDIIIEAKHEGSLFEMEQKVFVAIEGKS